jgi:hypothetical protein
MRGARAPRASIACAVAPRAQVVSQAAPQPLPQVAANPGHVIQLEEGWQQLYRDGILKLQVGPRGAAARRAASRAHSVCARRK